MERGPRIAAVQEAQRTTFHNAAGQKALGVTSPKRGINEKQNVY